MVNLVIAIMRTKEDIVNALKKKSLLWKKGVEVDGLIIEGEAGEEIPPTFLEDMMKLKIIGRFKKFLKPKE